MIKEAVILYLFEAVVEGKVMSDRVLPTGFAALVEGEVLGDILVNPGQGQSFVPGRLDRHRYQSRVRVRRPH